MEKIGFELRLLKLSSGHCFEASRTRIGPPGTEIELFDGKWTQKVPRSSPEEENWSFVIHFNRNLTAKRRPPEWKKLRFELRLLKLSSGHCFEASRDRIGAPGTEIELFY